MSKAMTYQEACRRYRVDRPAILVPSAEGERFLSQNNADAWTEDRQVALDSLLRRTRERLAATPVTP